METTKFASIQLSAGAVSYHEALGGQSIRCIRGALWVTQDGDPRDIILGPGERYEIDRPGGVVISAFEDSECWFEAVPACHSRHAATIASARRLHSPAFAASH